METFLLGFGMGFAICLFLAIAYIKRLNTAPVLMPMESDAHDSLLVLRTRVEDILKWINEELDKK